MDEQKFNALLDGQVPSIDDYAEFVDRLLCKPDAVAFVQLLAGQRRSEIGVALADQRQGLRAQIDGQLMIARAATSA